MYSSQVCVAFTSCRRFTGRTAGKESMAHTIDGATSPGFLNQLVCFVCRLSTICWRCVHELRRAQAHKQTPIIPPSRSVPVFACARTSNYTWAHIIAYGASLWPCTTFLRQQAVHPHSRKKDDGSCTLGLAIGCTSKGSGTLVPYISILRFYHPEPYRNINIRNYGKCLHCQCMLRWKA